ncbi:class I SAM-dependent methyltransferase [Moheibacter lacus]|nr:class I SAM-dependent methyltransferase [Moheibacter lacus]
MMNHQILETEVQEFILQHQKEDFRVISLRKSPFPTVSSAELAQQIKGFQIAKSKFPFLSETKAIFYPPSLNLEQASSWTTAQYKSKLVSGNTLIDLTAGMGIDAFAFSKEFESVTALERNAELAEISAHNYHVLGQGNLKYLAIDFETFFHENPDQKWDVIYLDPARRKGSQKKFLLEDLEPNLLEWMTELLSRTETLMVKLSPLLDLKMLIDQIPQIHEIHLVAVKNEMKELLLICKKENNVNPIIKAVNLESNQFEFVFQFLGESKVESQLSSVKKYIYEPNSAVLKSGAFKLVGHQFDLDKLEKNTHLYTSENLVKSFPGKVFKIIEEIKDAKKTIQNQAFHVVSKNYPMSVELIRKKYNLKESEAQTLIFTQSISGKHILKSVRLL